MAKKVAYVVFRGKTPGIYRTWDECEQQVKGFSGNHQQGYGTLKAAEEAWATHLLAEQVKDESQSFTLSLPLEDVRCDEPNSAQKRVFDADALSSEDIQQFIKKPRLQDPDSQVGDKDLEAKFVMVPPQVTQFSVDRAENFDITPDQEAVVQMALEGHNIFLTGAGGCGKTVTLKEIIRRFNQNKRKLQVVSPTGIAALPLGGVTTWSLLGWRPDSFRMPIAKLVDEVHTKEKKRVRKAVRLLELLIIEEVSMVENQILERMNIVFKAILQDDRPFGGKQVIIVGDFYQLPPVKPFEFCLHCGGNMSKSLHIECLHCRERGRASSFEDGDKWAFVAPTWTQLQLKYVHLKQIHRQKESHFQDILRKIRDGRLLSEEEWTELEREKVFPPEVCAIRLMSRKQKVKGVNSIELGFIHEQEYTWNALDSYTMCREENTHKPWVHDSPLKLHRLEETLVLKKGAKVVLMVNLERRAGLVNGSQGVVIGFQRKVLRDEDTGTATRFFAEERRNNYEPIVRFANGRELPIPPVDLTSQHGTSDTSYLATRIQIPLMLAWALSIHKSQGMSLEYVEVSKEDLFEPGQLYVGLSRATHLGGLKVTGFSREQLEIDDRVLKFYENAQWEVLTTNSFAS